MSSKVAPDKLAKYTPAGKLMCIICHEVVKSDAHWTAHTLTRKHIQVHLISFVFIHIIIHHIIIHHIIVLSFFTNQFKHNLNLNHNSPHRLYMH